MRCSISTWRSLGTLEKLSMSLIWGTPCQCISYAKWSAQWLKKFGNLNCKHCRNLNWVMLLEGNTANPIILLKKKDRDICFFVNFQKLNKVTKVDTYPIPQTRDSDCLLGAVLFATLVFMSRYWQIYMREEDITKTAFAYPGGLIELTWRPFSLKNAGAILQRALNLLMMGIIC